MKFPHFQTDIDISQYRTSSSFREYCTRLLELSDTAELEVSPICESSLAQVDELDVDLHCVVSDSTDPSSTELATPMSAFKYLVAWGDLRFNDHSFLILYVLYDPVKIYIRYKEAGLYFLVFVGTIADCF